MMKESTFESLLFLAQSEGNLKHIQKHCCLRKSICHFWRYYTIHLPASILGAFMNLTNPPNLRSFSALYQFRLGTLDLCLTSRINPTALPRSFISYRTSIKSMRPQIHINKRNLFKEQKPCSSIVSNVLMSKRMYFTDPT